MSGEVVKREEYMGGERRRITRDREIVTDRVYIYICVCVERKRDGEYIYIDMYMHKVRVGDAHNRVKRQLHEYVLLSKHEVKSIFSLITLHINLGKLYSEGEMYTLRGLACVCFGSLWLSQAISFYLSLTAMLYCVVFIELSFSLCPTDWLTVCLSVCVSNCL